MPKSWWEKLWETFIAVIKGCIDTIITLGKISAAIVAIYTAWQLIQMLMR